MKAVVAASRPWMDGDTIRKWLVELPAGSTIILSSRQGGDSLAAKIASDERALHVEQFDAENDNAFRQEMASIINEEIDSGFFFCCDNKEVEFFVSRFARSHRIPTEVIVQTYKD